MFYCGKFHIYRHRIEVFVLPDGFEIYASQNCLRVRTSVTTFRKKIKDNLNFTKKIEKKDIYVVASSRKRFKHRKILVFKDKLALSVLCEQSYPRKTFSDNIYQHQKNKKRRHICRQGRYQELVRETGHTAASIV